MSRNQNFIVISLKNESLKRVVPVTATAETLANACAAIVDDYFKCESLIKGKEVTITKADRDTYIEKITPKLTGFTQEGCKYETSVMRGIGDNFNKNHTFYMTLQQVKLYDDTH